MQKADSADPVLQQSTRIACAGLLNPQSTYDFLQWPELLQMSSDECKNFLCQCFSCDYEQIFGAQENSWLYSEKRKSLDFINRIDSNCCPLFIKSRVRSSNLDDRLHLQKFAWDLYNRAVSHNVKAEIYTPEMESGTSKSFIPFFLKHLSPQ